MLLTETQEQVRHGAGRQRALLADMAKDIEAARLLMHSAASKIDRGLDATKACSMAKCFAGDMAVARTADAVQVFGGPGYFRGFEVERLYRDAMKKGAET